MRDVSHPIIPLLLMRDVSRPLFPLLLMSDIHVYLCYWWETSVIQWFLDIDVMSVVRLPYNLCFWWAMSSTSSFDIDERRQRSTGSFAIDKRHTVIHKILVFFVGLFPLNHVFFHCLFCIFFRFGWKNIFLLFTPCFSCEKSIFCPVFSAALCEIIKCFILIFVRVREYAIF